MGNYLTQTGGGSPAGDLTDQFGNDFLTRVCGDGAGGVSVTKTERAIKSAEAMINTELGGFYSVPFASPVNEEIKTIALMLCEYFMYSQKPEFRRNDGTNPAGDGFKAAREMLKALRQQTPPLAGEATVETPAVLGTLIESDEKRDV